MVAALMLWLHAPHGKVERVALQHLHQCFIQNTNSLFKMGLGCKLYRISKWMHPDAAACTAR
jgi:hypothetical protein